MGPVRSNPSTALTNSSSPAEKAAKYKSKYEACCSKRKSKGKGCWPKNPGSAPLGLASDCRHDYKKWQKHKAEAGPSSSKTKQPEDDVFYDTGIEDEEGTSTTTVLFAVGAITVVGLGALVYLGSM